MSRPLRRHCLFLVLSAFTAALLFLAFAPLSFSYAAWISLVGLLFIVNRSAGFSSFIYPFLSGFFFYLASLFWLTNVTIAGWIILSGYLGLYFGFFGILAARIIKSRFSNLILSALTLSCIWVAFEFLRSHFLSGFSWNLLALSQFKQTALIQNADIFGAYATSFLILLANCSVFFLARCFFYKTQRKAAFGVLAVFLVIMTGNAIYGQLRLLKAHTESDMSEVSLALVQPSIQQYLKWEESARPYIMSTLYSLSLKAVSLGPDLIILPESALPEFLDEPRVDIQMFSSFTRTNQVYLLTGLLRPEGEDYYNSAVLFSPQGEIARIYNKLHLVPYGEFIPLRNLMPFVATAVGIGDFTAGKEYVVFSLPVKERTYRFGVLICFEDAFSYISRGFAGKNIDFLVNITNDAWFDRKAEPVQHLSQSVFRAVENRLPVVRTANTGVTCIIDKNGRIKDILKDDSGNFDQKGVLFGSVVPGDRTASIYTRWGDWFAWLCIFILAVRVGFLIKKRA